MFNAVIPLSPPIVAVQIDDEVIGSPGVDELLRKLEAFFMIPVVVVAWGQNAQFKCRGAVCRELDLVSEDLVWREFDLPAEPEIPF